MAVVSKTTSDAKYEDVPMSRAGRVTVPRCYSKRFQKGHTPVDVILKKVEQYIRRDPRQRACKSIDCGRCLHLRLPERNHTNRIRQLAERMDQTVDERHVIAIQAAFLNEHQMSMAVRAPMCAPIAYVDCTHERRALEMDRFVVLVSHKSNMLIASLYAHDSDRQRRDVCGGGDRLAMSHRNLLLSDWNELLEEVTVTRALANGWALAMYQQSGLPTRKQGERRIDYWLYATHIRMQEMIHFKGVADRDVIGYLCTSGRNSLVQFQTLARNFGPSDMTKHRLHWTRPRFTPVVVRE